MAERKWGAIASGATFEALATTIVYFEDPKAALFGRRGKDGGQDARSGDGTRVFQAKHHEDGSAASAIRDAKKEAAKVQAYRQPGHMRYEQWNGVTHWRLVTNAAFNPTDRQTWDNEVVPLFSAQGLVVDYWERENLNALLDKHPEIHRSFFQNETRAFLSVPEVRERLPGQEPFLRRDELGVFCGRDAELAEVRSFLASRQLFLVVHGTGGMGKTRLLVEAGEMIASEGTWQVLWANVASMAATGAWFESVVPERPTLLLVDEPADEAVLRQLSEQLGERVGRTAHWKVAVAVRSPKDPVLRFLFGPRMKATVKELGIGALLDADAEAMCGSLLASGKLASIPDEQRRHAARELSRRFSRHPVWLTLAVQLLEERGDLTQVPTTAKDLANEYLLEVERCQSESSPEVLRDLLRWVALIGAVNREDDPTIKLIGETSQAGGLVEVRRKLAALVARRALAERGARNRLVELKPDVLRDHVLLSWLSVDVGFGAQPIVASEDAQSLIETVRGAVVAGKLSALGRSILVSLARTEFLLRLSGHDVKLLLGLFEAIQAAVPTMTASQRLALADVLEAVAPFHPIPTARVIAAIRQSPAPNENVEGLFGTRIVGQEDVVLALAWPLFHGAMGAQDAEAQEAVLREMCSLAEAEVDLAPRLKRGLPNDGKRAASLVERVLEGGPQFWDDFDGVAKTLGGELLNSLARRPPTPGERALLKALLQPAMAVERRQTWSDGHTMHIQTFAIGPDHPAWSTRNELLTRTKQALSADTTPVASRIALWRLFAETHHSINRLCRRGEREERKDDRAYDALLSDLVWARTLLERRSTTVEELSAARELWDWHHRFESVPELKEASDRLEALYAANDLAAEFEPLLARDDWEQKEPRASAKAAELSSASTTEDLVGFIERAVVFLGSERDLYQLMDVAWELGKYAEACEIVQLFVKRSLGQPSVSARSDFGAVTAASWVAGVRKSEHSERTHLLVAALMAECGSEEQRANLLQQIYGRIPKPRDVGEFTAHEHALLRAQSAVFAATGRSVAYLAALALTLAHDWPTLRPLLEAVLRSLPIADLPQALRGLADAMYWGVRQSEAARLPTGLGEWLLNQLLLIPDFDDLGGQVEWRLKEIFKRVGHIHVSWLPGALAVRRDLEARKEDEPGARVVSYHARVSKYVQSITVADVDDDRVAKAIDALMAFVGDNGSAGYHMPKMLRDLDPEGLVVPTIVAAQVSAVTDAEQLLRLARIGGAYGVGTTAWRVITKAAITAGRKYGVDARRSLFSALGERGLRSWSGELGEVPTIFVSAVEDARSSLKSEADADLRPFWEWRLAIAEAELRDQEERAKEERGE